MYIHTFSESSTSAKKPLTEGDFGRESSPSVNIPLGDSSLRFILGDPV
jgi:hypothetical protein